MFTVGFPIDTVLLCTGNYTGPSTAYYRYRYGSVDQSDRRERNRWLAVAVIGFFVLGRLDNALEWTISLRLVPVAVSLLVIYWHDGRIRPHYLAAGLVWLAAGLSPMPEVSPAVARFTLYGLGGLTLIACGIGDHALLTRTLAYARTADDASRRLE